MTIGGLCPDPAEPGAGAEASWPASVRGETLMYEQQTVLEVASEDGRALRMVVPTILDGARDFTPEELIVTATGSDGIQRAEICDGTLQILEVEKGGPRVLGTWNWTLGTDAAACATSTDTLATSGRFENLFACISW